jgi:Hydantoinase/oxoprolinase
MSPLSKDSHACISDSSYSSRAYVTFTCNNNNNHHTNRYFPHIFGPNEDEPLDAAGPAAAFEQLAADIQADTAANANANNNSSSSSISSSSSVAKSAEEVAYGFLIVAIEAMCRPIRNLTTMKVRVCMLFKDPLIHNCLLLESVISRCKIVKFMQYVSPCTLVALTACYGHQLEILHADLCVLLVVLRITDAMNIGFRYNNTCTS